MTAPKQFDPWLQRRGVVGGGAGGEAAAGEEEKEEGRAGSGCGSTAPAAP